MLTIVNDPTGATGRERQPFDLAVSLQANIERHLESGSDCTLIINGLQVDPLTDPRLDAPPTLLDSVIVVRRPAGVESIFYYVLVAIVAIAVSMSMVPNLPGNQTTNDSPNNRLTGQTNTARAYQGIPDVYGLRRVWPDLIQPSSVQYINHIKYVTEWMCVSRGKGTLSAIQYAETPIDDISGSSYEVFEPVSAGYPEDGVTTLVDVLETFASDEVNGQEIESLSDPSGRGRLEAAASANFILVTLPNRPDLDGLKDEAPSGTARVEFTWSGGNFDQVCVVDSFTLDDGSCQFVFLIPGTWPTTVNEPFIDFTITVGGGSGILGPFTLPVACSRLRWNVVYLRGLQGVVTLRAEWWQVDSGGLEIGGTRESRDDTYDEETYDQRAYTEDATPVAGFGRYRFSIQRITPRIEDGSADVAKLEELYAVRHYPTKTLPGVTAFRVTTKATEQATGFSDRKFNLRWHRHVRELDSDTLSASRNFARAMAHIWTIAGNDVSELDIDALQAVNDDLGEDSGLLRFDGSLDDADMSLGERMQVVANMARCVVWRDGAKWTITRDQARGFPDLQLDYRNLAASGESALSYASHLPASHDGVEVEYVDETSQSKKAYHRLSIATGVPVIGTCANPQKVKMPYCTTFYQAENRGLLEARKLLYQRISVQDEALSEAGTLGIGSLIRWVDPADFAGDDGLQAGEVVGITGLTLRTSEPLDWMGVTTGRILLTGQDGLYVSDPIVCTPVAGGVLLASLPAGVYVADADRQLGSRYAFGPGLSEAEIESASLFTVTEIKPSQSGAGASLSFVNYDPRVYADD